MNKLKIDEKDLNYLANLNGVRKEVFEAVKAKKN